MFELGKLARGAKFMAVIGAMLFVAACAFMLYSSFTYAMSLDPGSIGAIIGICMVFSGIPVLWCAKWRTRRMQDEG